ncbi:LssY C-terminal domain-containing protein [Vibrio scophthalmi]|uniref:Snare associated protein n=1 Tax=Vibrio scophthalmi LMG 19158 TaxID=870967 RepID=F9RTP8_9VIBR|nr:LssY C-terminal domain-containing protein [Vibrio scophthalmi]EGU30937.1 snare associated protein [Vibrio scophthalmi LMG 19158]
MLLTGEALFIGALLDALIGPNLFVPGEPFLLAAGYQLQQGVWSGLIAVFVGAILGDHISYFIGRYLGGRAQRKLSAWLPKTRRPIARCRRLMHQKGNYVLTFARLLGPIAWVVPFMAGSNKISWRRFAAFDLVGVLLGGGQFVMWGYLLAIGVDQFPLLTQAQAVLVEHQYLLLILICCIVFLYFGRKLRWRFFFAKSTLFAFSLMLLANYSHFFWFADDFQKQSKDESYKQVVVDANQLLFKAYPGKSGVFDAQAINVVYIGENPRSLMKKLGWIENQTFSRNDIEFKDYLRLLRDKKPPVSDLFWHGLPQEMAFQLPGDLMHRSHIRWWQVGIDGSTEKPMWVGALSYDNGLQFTPYSGIFTVLHSIDPNVDTERDRLAAQITRLLPHHLTLLQPLSKPRRQDDEHDYSTDGRILMIQEQSLLSIQSHRS